MNKKGILLWSMLLLAVNLLAQEDTLKFRIYLRDKAATNYTLDHPQAYLSERAIARRVKQGIEIDSTDLPVCRSYVDEISRQGAKVIATGKWENFVTVSCNDTTVVERIATLPFVRSVKKVWRAPRWQDFSSERDTLRNRIEYHSDSLYGGATAQIEISRGEKLHEAGFKGSGMIVAVIDAGFHNVDCIPLLQNVQILGTKDFVNPSGDLFAESRHGTGVLSCMAANQPHVMIGTAPEASFWLLRSEDESSEQLVEQDYFAAAVEFADSVGVDLLNSSLGYYQFDDPSENYTYRDLDGKHALISRQASHVAEKGMILVCSAGNSGLDSWKKITPPGDADKVLTVGAIDSLGELAPFSSVGNSSDNRIKPDVVAVGRMSRVIRGNGETGSANGTSFASPIMCGLVACLWQACPTLTATEVIELVHQAGDRADAPDNIYGYGIPDMWKAYQNYQLTHQTEEKIVEDSE